MVRRMGRCYNTAVVVAQIDQVWATIKDFHQMGWGEPVITKLEKVGDTDGTKVGARRILNGAFHETLRVFDESSYSFSYSIDDGPGPVSSDQIDNYLGTVRLYPVTDCRHTFVEWAARFESSDVEAVGQLCDPIYEGLLAALKRSFAIQRR